jgi:LmbE family N-acetylglucosaminyl deacetylase
MNIAGTSGVTIERAVAGTPHKGKVLALVTPHLDDGPIFAFGTIAKLLQEGYTGYFIRTSNDEKDSYDLSVGETVLANERDSRAFVKTTGLAKLFDLGYRNHRMDDISRIELRARLIFLFRLLKVDTVFTYDPWDHYEENPDHWITAQAVEAACWTAGGGKDFPEHFEAGLKPHGVRDKYYFARGPQQLVNRVVDIAPTLDRKRAAIHACRTMVTNMLKGVNASLAARKLRVPEFSGNEEAAIDGYIRAVFERRDAAVGRQHGLDYAEQFRYIAPDPALEEYISGRAVPL